MRLMILFGSRVTDNNLLSFLLSSLMISQSHFIELTVMNMRIRYLMNFNLLALSSILVADNYLFLLGSLLHCNRYML